MMALSVLFAVFAGCTIAASIQKPLAQKDYGIPLLAFPAFTEDWIYFGATLGIGSEGGQVFNTIIDLNSGGTYIESTRCRSRDCCPQDHTQYNHSRSTTYVTDGTAANFTGYTPFVEGIVSHDTLRLGHDLVIPNHTFIETTWSYTQLPYLYDSILGLSPSQMHYWYRPLRANVSIPGVFQEYMALNNPDDAKRNMFSLLAPYFPGRLGDLSFGTVQSDLYEGELVRHEIYPRGADTWQLQAPTVRVLNSSGETILERNLDNFVVHLDSALPGVIFPSHSDIAGLFQSAPLERDCSTPEPLPTLVLDFDGQEIILEAKDYLVKGHDLWGARQCTCLIGEMDEGIVDTRGNDFMYLGTDFLKMVYAVFDWDDRSISFAKPNRKVIPFSGSQADLEGQFRPTAAESLCYNPVKRPPGRLI